MAILRMKAEYCKSEVSEYRGNPLIEALPRILTVEEVARSVGNYPELPGGEIALDASVRLHCVHRMLDLVVAIPLHLDLAQAVSEVLRRGYVGRNPMEVLTTKHLYSVAAGNEARSGLTSTATSFCLVGLSGMGKTTALKVILRSYPQVIWHKKYNSRSFINAQIVYLYIDCPFDGTLKGLCLSFFDAVDEALGRDHYGEKYSSKSSVDEMVRGMKKIASTFYLGALFVDELQHLKRAKTGGSENMLNFFVNLVNSVGIPIILIGNNSMLNLFSDQMRNARRASGLGVYEFERFDKDDVVWSYLVDEVWKYQWLPQFLDISQDVRDALYDLTQGVTDFLVKLMILAQRYAIQEDIDCLSIDILRRVANDRMKILKPALDALRSNDYRKISMFEDLLPAEDQINSMMAWTPSTSDVLGLLGRSRGSELTISTYSSSSHDDKPRTKKKRIDDPLEDFRARGLVVSDLEEFD